MKCALIGDSLSGKSALLRTYINSGSKISAKEAYVPTLLEKYWVTVKEKGEEVAIEFWEIGGQMRERFLQQKNIRWDCFLVCFNIVFPESLDNAEFKWVQDIKKLQPGAAIYLVGCKADLRDDQETIRELKSKDKTPISYQQGEERARRIAAGYVECSSKQNTGVKEVFDEAITTIVLRGKPLEQKSNEDQQNENNQYQEMVAKELKKEELKLDEKREVPPEELLKTLLDTKNVTINQLMEDSLRGELLRQFRLRNKKLIEFLTQRSVLSTLISYATKGDPNIQNEKASVELLTADVSSMLDVLSSEDSGLWGELFQVIQQAPPLKNLSYTLNFTKIASFIILNRNVEFMLFIKTRQDLLQFLVGHLGTECIMQLLLVMFGVEKQMEAFQIHMRWSSDLVPLFVEKVENSESTTLEEDLAGLRDFLDVLIFKYPTSTLLKELQGQQLVDAVVTKTLKKEGPATSEYMDILLRFFQVCINTQQYETIEMPPLISTILNQEGREKRGDSNLVFPMQKLFQLLYKPSTMLPPTITTTAGIVAPLGSLRLKCVQLVLMLLKSNFHLLDTALVEYKIIARCIDLFFQFKWNNILHSAVEAITRYILEFKPSFLCLHLLRDCQLVDRIIQAQQNEEQEKKMKAPKEQAVPHLGYMGHLYVIANTILKSSKKHSAIFYFLDDVPQRGWKKFMEKLQQINALETQFTPPPNNALVSKKEQLKFSSID